MFEKFNLFVGLERESEREREAHVLKGEKEKKEA
jgi:hypothetical protein